MECCTDTGTDTAAMNRLSLHLARIGRYYKMDERGGSSAMDATGNGNTASYVDIAPQWEVPSTDQLRYSLLIYGLPRCYHLFYKC